MLQSQGHGQVWGGAPRQHLREARVRKGWPGVGWGRQQARFGIHHGDKRPRREILRRHESTERPARPRLATPCSTPTWPAPPPPAREQEQARAHPRACPWPLELRGAHPQPARPVPSCPARSALSLLGVGLPAEDVLELVLGHELAEAGDEQC